MVNSTVLWFSHRPPVSVCGTGTLYLSSRFSSQCGFINFVTKFHSPSSLNLKVGVLHCLQVLWFSHGFPSPWIDYPPASLHRLLIDIRWYGNIYPLSIAYSVRSRLRPRLTLGGRTFPRKPWAFDGGDSRSAFATHAGILSCMQSTTPFGMTSAHIQCSPTITNECNPNLRCKVLAPCIFGASSLDQWAITHSLNEWLLLSQHPGCLSNKTSFYT